MTFSDLHALHAIIGAAIDDMERMYRPATSRRPSCASTARSTNTSSSRSHYSHSATDSDVDGEEADVSAPPTPTSPQSPPGVRFASNHRKRGRERAQTMPSVPQVVPTTLPPPILKQPPLDFPSLDNPVANPNLPPNAPMGPDCLGETPRQKEWKKKCEELTLHPEVISATSKIVAACGQIVSMVQKPFLTLCDAAMGYHLPSCLRFLEATHIVEILRESGSRGMHVDEIVNCIYASPDAVTSKRRIDANKLSHILRLLATHHIMREVRPNVFANNRISSVMDSGKPWRDLVGSSEPEKKYEDTDGFAAFVGLCTDEIFKASAFLTDCYFTPEPPAVPPPPPPEASLPSPTLTSPPRSPMLPSNSSVASSSSVPMPSGMYTPNDSTVSLPAGSSSPIQFAKNPSPNAHRRAQSTLSSDFNPAEDPATPSPPTPHSRTRPRAFSFRRLSSRSTTPTPETPRSPPLPHHLHMRTPIEFQDPTTPRSSAASTPQAIPYSDSLDELLATPRSPPSCDSASLSSLGSTVQLTNEVKKKASFASFVGGSLGKKASMNALAHAFGAGKKNDAHRTGGNTPPTPRSPLVERSRQASVQGYVGGHMRYVGRTAQDQDQDQNAGAPGLGPAFDLRPRPPTSPASESAAQELDMPFAAIPPTPTVSPMAVVGASMLVPLPAPAPIMMRRASTKPMSVRTSGASPGMLRHAPSLPSLSPSALRRSRVPSEPVPPLPVSSRVVELRRSAQRLSSSQASGSSSGSSLRYSPKKAEFGPSKPTKEESSKGMSRDHEMFAPFNVAFDTRTRYFEWLEREENVFRLRRFGKAMTGTSGWEVAGSVFSGFPWEELLSKSVVVDVGGGIGSTSMLLANAFPHLRFVIQDRPPVVEMGTAAWRERHPNFLDTGRAAFQAHDFFKPQPPLPVGLDVERKETVSDAFGTREQTSTKPVVPSVFLLRVVTHDWPDSYVVKILLRLRQAAGPNTRLLLADHVLPLACVDEDEDVEPETPDSEHEDVFGKKLTRESAPGTVRTMAPEGAPLLPNLGKANAVAYWLDLCMRVMFNSQERTLREIADLTAKTGWKITRVTRTEGSVFGHIVAIPVDIPPETLALPMYDEPEQDQDASAEGDKNDIAMVRLPMGETFMSSTRLPTEDAMKAGLVRGKIGADGASSGNLGFVSAARRRERANTFTGKSASTPEKEAAARNASEARKGWRSIVQMWSSQVRKASVVKGVTPVDDSRYALTRQPSKGL